MNAPRVNYEGKRMNFYDFFGVDEKSSDEELKKAYRAMCHKFHPDKSQNKTIAEENFKAIQGIWNVLKDFNKRKEYDRLLAIERGELFDQKQGFGIRFTYQWANSSGGTSTSATTWW